MTFKQRIKYALTPPVLRNLDLDDPETSIRRSAFFNQKPFLRRLYEDWYKDLKQSLPRNVSGPVIELGSGGGFIKKIIPGVITSEILRLPTAEVILDAHDLPFADASLRGLLMIEVFHHLSNAGKFLDEAGRCVKPGGVVAMIEPWNTPWARLIYRHFHHEPFDSKAVQWHFPKGGPLSQANSALPWIVFCRDRDRFMKNFPAWEILGITLHTPFSYLLSGGVSMRNLMPKDFYGIIRDVEHLMSPLMPAVAMFSLIVLKKKHTLCS